MNDREKAIVQGYIDCIEGRQVAYALRDNGKWTKTRNPKKCYKINFQTPDGLSYCGYPWKIEKMMNND